MIVMIFNINSTRRQTRFLTCVARVTCLVYIIVPNIRKNDFIISNGVANGQLEYLERIVESLCRLTYDSTGNSQYYNQHHAIKDKTHSQSTYNFKKSQYCDLTSAVPFVSSI